MTTTLRSLLLPLSAATALTLSAQDKLLRDYDWAVTPTLHTSEKVADAPTTVIRSVTMVDWEDEGDALNEYYLTHQIRHIGAESAVEDNNKVYIALNDVSGIVSKKARVIDPQGKVVTLTEEEFKLAEDEEEHQRYLYFAFNGVQVGSEIEYLIVLKKEPSTRGDREMLQYSSPVVRRELHLITPAHLVLGTKGYNGAPEAVFDSSRTDVRHLTVTATDLKGLKKEHSSYYAANAMQTAYKLDANLARNTRDFSSYVNATKMYHSVLYPTVEPKLQKELRKLIKDMDLDAAKDPEDKVRRMEDHLKTRFNIVSVGAMELRDPATIIKNKAMNNVGAMVMTTLLLTELGMEHQVVVTSDRQNYRFDKDFESYLGLQREFIYLPTLKKYMAPTEVELRVGYIPAEYMDNQGLFIRTVDVGGTRTGIGKVGYIEPLADDKCIHDIHTQVDLASEPGKAVIHMENSLSGYYAQFLQPFYSMLDAENKEKVLDNMVGFLTEDSESKQVDVVDHGSMNFGVKPVVIKVDVTSSKFLEQAGDKTLFKIGDLIGPQMELYADKERTLPVDDDHARRYERVITVTLPKGARIENLGDLKFDRSLVRDGRELLKFHSDYTLEGDVLTVTVVEFYKVCQLPISEFEAYRSVVNAAADFNKVTLVLARS